MLTKYLQDRLIGARELVKECPNNPLAKKNLEELEELEKRQLGQVGGGAGQSEVT